MGTDRDEHAIINARAKAAEVRELAELHSRIVDRDTELVDALTEAEPEPSDDLVELRRLLDDHGVSGDTWEGIEDSMQDAIDAWPLGMDVHGRREPGGEWLVIGFELLLTFGGPACRLVASLGGGTEIVDARIEYCGWGTPWTALADIPGRVLATHEVCEFLEHYFGHYCTEDF